MKKSVLPPASSDWAYFLDVDGTLVEFAAHPDGVVISAELSAMITSAFACCNGALAVVSGRALQALDALLGMPHLPMAGQHGLERRDAYGHLHQHVLAPAVLQEMHDLLAPLQRRHRGLLLEHKGASLAIHYRQLPRLGSYLHRCINDYLAQQAHGLQMQKGKYVLELKPQGYDKGSAIAEFMLQAPFAGRRPVFIGDDLTDEHGFVRVNAMNGISIKVGKGRTHARYRLPNVAAVHDWLTAMTHHCKQKEPA